MLRFVPPAGAPLRTMQILGALRKAAFSNRQSEASLSSVSSLLQVRHVWGISSARAGLCAILKSLHRLRPDRCIVAIPAYTCFTVPAAVVRAGLKLQLVDIELDTLDFDFAQLEALPAEKLLCIVTSNLFGLVNDIRRIGQIAQAKGAFLVDDAAQALGASRGGCLAGTLADVGLYSLGRGKAVTTMEGGIIVCNSDEIAGVIDEEVRNLPASSFIHSVKLLARMLVYATFLEPRLYWIPNSLPFLRLGVTEFEPAFPVHVLPGLARALLPELMAQLADLNQSRRRIAAALTSALEGNPQFIIPRPSADCQPTYIRFPVILPAEPARRRALQLLHAAGIGASPFYPSAVCDIPGIDSHVASRNVDCAKAENLSQRLLTLPTHPFVRPRDVEAMGDILTRV